MSCNGMPDCIVTAFLQLHLPAADNRRVCIVFEAIQRIWLIARGGEDACGVRSSASRIQASPQAVLACGVAAACSALCARHSLMGGL